MRPAVSVRARLQQLDERLLERAVRVRSPHLDPVLVGITRAASYSVLWLAIAGVLAARGREPGRRAAAHGLAAVGVAATVANGPAKLLTRRSRPSPESSQSLIGLPRSTSFPSGHSASAFAFASGACSQAPGLAPLLVPLAGAVAYSRVHTGVHYPSDVAAGALLGIGAGALVSRLGRGSDGPALAPPAPLDGRGGEVAG
jgi:undecaprenyl-diphosphatase